MKIVHICLGGGWYEKNAYQDQLLPHHQRLLGHDVTIIASQYGRWNLEKNGYDMDTTPTKILNDGIKLVRVRPALPLSLNTHVHLFCGVKKALQKENPDLLFAHGVEILNHLCLPAYKKKHPEVKIVCDNHGDRINSLHHWSTRLWSKLISRRIIAKRLIPVTEWFYGVTPSRCEFLTDVYGVPKEKVKLLVMGADDEKMHLEQRPLIRKRIREENGITDSDFLVVTGGRFSKSKGQRIAELIKAISCSKESKLKLLIFGPISDDIKPLFDQVADSRTLFIGGIPSDKVYDYFYAADLVAFPGLHSVMWEQAVASKVPCLFNKIQGFEHVDYGGNCLWLEGDSAEYYQRVVERIINDKELYENMLKQANSEASLQFLYSSIAKKVINDCFNS